MYYFLTKVLQYLLAIHHTCTTYGFYWFSTIRNHCPLLLVLKLALCVPMQISSHVIGWKFGCTTLVYFIEGSILLLWSAVNGMGIDKNCFSCSVSITLVYQEIAEFIKSNFPCLTYLLLWWLENYLFSLVHWPCLIFSLANEINIISNFLDVWNLS